MVALDMSFIVGEEGYLNGLQERQGAYNTADFLIDYKYRQEKERQELRTRLGLSNQSNLAMALDKPQGLALSYGPDGRRRHSPLCNVVNARDVKPPTPPPASKIPRIEIGVIGGRSAFMRFATPTTQV